MTGKERAALRSEAHHLSVQVHIGHAGLTETVLRTTERGEVMRWRAKPGCRPTL